MAKMRWSRNITFPSAAAGQKGILAFLAQDGEKRFFCYANSDLRKEEQADEVLQFVKFWKHRTGSVPEELIFDSKLTTYANLNKLNRQDVKFITLRRRSQKLLDEIGARPRSAWRRIELDGVSRIYKTPRILDQQIRLRDYDEPIRQIPILDLGHEEPTLLLTNHLHRSPAQLIQRYAQRMLIENNIEDGVNFFHLEKNMTSSLRVTDRLALFPDSTSIENDSLRIAGQDLASLADRYGSPLYLYDRATMDAAAAEYHSALQRYYLAPSQITDAGKAFLCKAVAGWTQAHGLLVDCTGEGEIAIARAAGVPREHILVHGVNKSSADLKSALENAGTIVVDNLTELKNLESRSLLLKLQIWLRLVPGIAVHTHHTHTQTGQYRRQDCPAVRSGSGGFCRRGRYGPRGVLPGRRPSALA